jgi:hypothetical protein
MKQLGLQDFIELLNRSWKKGGDFIAIISSMCSFEQIIMTYTNTVL